MKISYLLTFSFLFAFSFLSDKVFAHDELLKQIEEILLINDQSYNEDNQNKALFLAHVDFLLTPKDEERLSFLLLNIGYKNPNVISQTMNSLKAHHCIEIAEILHCLPKKDKDKIQQIIKDLDDKISGAQYLCQTINHLDDLALKKAQEYMNLYLKTKDFKQKSSLYDMALFFAHIAFTENMTSPLLKNVFPLDQSYQTLDIGYFIENLPAYDKIILYSNLIQILPLDLWPNYLVNAEKLLNQNLAEDIKSLASTNLKFSGEHKKNNFYFSPSKNMNSIYHYLHEESLNLYTALNDMDFIYLKSVGDTYKFNNVNDNAGFIQITKLYNGVAHLIKNDFKFIKENKKKEICKGWAKLIEESLSHEQKNVFAAFTIYSGIMLDCKKEKVNYQFLFELASGREGKLKSYFETHQMEAKGHVPLLMGLTKSLDSISETVKYPNHQHLYYEEAISHFRSNVNKLALVKSSFNPYSLDKELINIFIRKSSFL